ncbi:kinesin-like protein Klp9 [Schizosaccharomyces cryophilus OY26]|uniref:Kinesin-like protein Klp9 n=1 Tax=Schizosaccharomyces cryophilus (strain OY26 / ATCC MYA-4695 / CBS 11777 / NBRC 106824 / NRRL Y48691) TaxID=653667 RepID=S9W1Q2_SCHCR|nr:kinesin-like protein Klp9 [Schizosaccharomyces cryophilus OY26]EPY53948.1 kinesin-like protein Klp9 [Schizosaccharomyces cryophilus OY26]
MIQTFLRVKRAPHQKEDASPTYGFVTILNDDEIILESPEDSHAFRVSKAKTSEKTSFSKVFSPTCSQWDVFVSICAPLLSKSLFHMHDALLFTLGVSGAGKTYTLFGPQDHPGVVYLALDALFYNIRGREASFPVVESLRSKLDKCKILEGSKYLKNEPSFPINVPSPDSYASLFPEKPDQSFQYAIYLSFSEIYNDRIFDLLEKSSFFGHRHALSLKKSTTSDKKSVAGIQKVYVADPQEAFRLVYKVLQLRKSTSTKSNSVSSRSHLVVSIELFRLQPAKNHIESCQLDLVDLAGSERTRSAETSGLLLREGASINKSLLTLGQCLEALRRKHDGRQHIIPFRQSKLTELLFHSGHLSGTARTCMLVNIDPLGSFDENAQVMRYSANAREIIPTHSSYTENIMSPSFLRGATHSKSAQSSNSETILLQSEQLQRENECLRQLLADADSEMVNLEYEIREQMTREMEERVSQVEQTFLNRMLEETAQGIEYTDQKIEKMGEWVRRLQQGNKEKDECIAHLEHIIEALQEENNNKETNALQDTSNIHYIDNNRRSSRKLHYEDKQAIEEAHNLHGKRKLWPEPTLLQSSETEEDEGEGKTEIAPKKKTPSPLKPLSPSKRPPITKMYSQTADVDINQL